VAGVTRVGSCRWILGHETSVRWQPQPGLSKPGDVSHCLGLLAWNVKPGLKLCSHAVGAAKGCLKIALQISVARTRPHLQT